MTEATQRPTVQEARQLFSYLPDEIKQADLRLVRTRPPRPTWPARTRLASARPAAIPERPPARIVVREGTSALFGDPRLPARFWEKVEIQPSGCWLWTRSTSSGYGTFAVGTRDDPCNVVAHRYLYCRLFGVPDEWLVIDHLCHNLDLDCRDDPCVHRRCVCPDHLEAVPQSVNVQRGRNGGTDTHCRKGHDLSVAGVYYWKGWRHCRSCRREIDERRGSRRGVAQDEPGVPH